MHKAHGTQRSIKLLHSNREMKLNWLILNWSSRGNPQNRNQSDMGERKRFVHHYNAKKTIVQFNTAFHVASHNVNTILYELFYALMAKVMIQTGTHTLQLSMHLSESWIVTDALSVLWGHCCSESGRRVLLCLLCAAFTDNGHCFFSMYSSIWTRCL